MTTGLHHRESWGAEGQDAQQTSGYDVRTLAAHVLGMAEMAASLPWH